MRALTRRRVVGVVTAATVTVALAAVAAPATAAPAPHPSRHALHDSTPRWLANASVHGSVAPSSRIGFGLLLSMRNSAGAQQTLQTLSDPDSASYGKWLSSSQFRARYAPTTASVHAVQAWLRSQGFTVTSTMKSGMYVGASGTAKQIDKVFGTTLKSYTFQGRTVHGNASALSLPASTPSSVVSAVHGVLGLDQGTELKTPADTEPGPPAGARYGVQPCSKYYGQKIATAQPVGANGKHEPYAVCGYTPAQYQSAYGETQLIKHGIDGRGVTVAIVDAYSSPTMLGDAQTYNRVHRQPLFRKGQYREIIPPKNGYNDIDACGASGWYGEETLDVESVHAMAPGADVVYVGGTDCESGLDTAWAQTIDNHVADIITNSWTDGVDDVSELGQSYIDYYTQFSLEAALTGITVNFSSGDDGDHTKGGTDLASKTAEFPADVPYVTGVGGSSVLIGSHGQWLHEYGWQTNYQSLVQSQYGGKDSWGPAAYSSGGGGGTSQVFAQPFYQKGVVPTSISEYYGKTPMRSVPDIAMPADPNTGMIVGETQTFSNGTYWDQYRIGGTSLASPLMAGVIAVASQKAGHPLGFVNPLYYKLVHTNAVHDTVAPKSPVQQVRTNYVNGVDNSQGKAYILQTIDVQTSTLKDMPGYDDETGVGTPNGPNFFAALARLGGLHGKH